MAAALPRGRRIRSDCGTEVELAKKISGRPAATERMIESNLRLSSRSRRTTATRGCHLDLIRRGRSADPRGREVRPRRGYKFSTYATWWIRRPSPAARRQARTIRMPVHIVERMQKMNRAERTRMELGREPTLEEIAEAASLPSSRRAGESDARASASLDQPVGEQGGRGVRRLRRR
jgi:DNA-directed RNA polymerase sigma subunit (sigma70/sigma32)